MTCVCRFLVEWEKAVDVGFASRNFLFGNNLVGEHKHPTQLAPAPPATSGVETNGRESPSMALGDSADSGAAGSTPEATARVVPPLPLGYLASRIRRDLARVLLTELEADPKPLAPISEFASLGPYAKSAGPSCGPLCMYYSSRVPPCPPFA